MGADSIIFIRTDGNATIATGHLVRCLCIAQTLENLGKKVCFLVSDEESENLLKHLSSSIFSDFIFSYETLRLESAEYDHLESELPELIFLLKTYVSPVLFIDSYYVTPTYFEALSPYAKLAYMDDLLFFDYDVDLVINYDVIPLNKWNSYKQFYSKAKKCLLGAEYTPLRPQFQNCLFQIKENIQDILITTGGSDPYGFCESMILSFLSKNPGITLHIVIGKLFSQTTITALEKLASQSSFIKLHRNVSNMAELMKQCDFAVSAAGTTLYELCAIGVPAISFTFADNQIIMAETFSETGAIPYAGDIRYKISNHTSFKSNITTETTFFCKNKINNTKEQVISHINTEINKFISTPHNRNLLHTQMKNLVDGNGTLKIARELCQLA